MEGELATARREAVGEAGPSAVAGEVDSEEGEFAANVGVDVGCLSPDADVAGTVGNDGGPEQLAPVRSRDRERCDHNRASTVGACLGNERVDERRRGKGEERLAMKGAAGRAGGAGPAGHGEGVLSLSAGLGVASEKTRKEGVRLGGEGVDGQGPAAQGGELVGLSSDEVAADWAGDLGGAGAGIVVSALGVVDPAGRNV